MRMPGELAPYLLPGGYASSRPTWPDPHPADCDGSLTVANAGFGGQDLTYECPHPAHSGPQPPPPDPGQPIRPVNPQPPVQQPPPPRWDPFSALDMLALARWALEGWRAAPGGSAAERRAARSLAFAFGRLDDLGALDRASSPG